MTTTDIPERTPSPTNAAAASEATSRPVASSDTPSPPEATGNDQTKDSTTPSHDSEAEQTTRVAEDQPARPQTTDAAGERISPEVEGLKAMFPDFDAAILQSVLQSVGGDQERAADVLLGMSDPSYVSQQQPTRSQTDLDEEFARQLLLDEQRQQAAWHPDQPYPYPYPQGPRQTGNVPYQPRILPGPYHHGYQQQRGNSPPQQTEGGRDTMTGVQEQFTKIAETGKKTFSSLVSRVKAKMQEFDQGKNQSGSSQQPQESSWGSGTPSGASPPRNEYSPPAQPPPQGSQSPPPTEAVQGYDTNPAPAASTGLSSGSAASAAPAPAERIPARPPSAGNVDPSKIGMLPKRPVSLLDTSASQPQTQSGTVARQDPADDELDYVENPFEDKRK